ncbi:MAG: hypothetical protein SPK95_05895 [Veillonella caviae]|uniref:dUTP diphosphatase n=1 Tax=Veillonella caviae TaxID=248316 RepID=UPI002A918B41|nr:hypothetical protein [Veillonella caviae]MDY5715449.1 hypothetical protein [Veillonella caviae]
MNQMKIKAKRLSDTAKLPTYGSEKAACCDLYADLSDHCITLNPDVEVRNISGNENGPIQRVGIAPHSTIKIPTGWAFQPPEGYAGFIYARSGLATKNGLRPSNCVGVCDEDYSGAYIVAIHNDTDEYQFIHTGDRIAQLEFRPYEQSEFELVDELDKTERGLAGFGSTGV